MVGIFPAFALGEVIAELEAFLRIIGCSVRRLLICCRDMDSQDVHAPTELHVDSSHHYDIHIIDKCVTK